LPSAMMFSRRRIYSERASFGKIAWNVMGDRCLQHLPDAEADLTPQRP
jgi:hypothetical protein